MCVGAQTSVALGMDAPVLARIAWFRRRKLASPATHPLDLPIRSARVPTGGCARMHSRVPAFACACACGAKCARVCVYRKHRARDCLRRQTRNTPAEASPCYLPAHAQPLLARSSNPRAPPQPARRLRTSSAGTIHTCARNVEHLPLAWRHNLHPLVPAAAHWRPGRQQRRPKQCRGSAHDEASANSITVRGAMFGL